MFQLIDNPDLQLGFIPPTQPGSDFLDLYGEVYGVGDNGASVRAGIYQTLAEDLTTQIQANSASAQAISEGLLADQAISASETAIDYSAELAGAVQSDAAISAAADSLDQAAAIAGLPSSPNLGNLPGSPSAPVNPITPPPPPTTPTPPAQPPPPAPPGPIFLPPPLSPVWPGQCIPINLYDPTAFTSGQTYPPGDPCSDLSGAFSGPFTDLNLLLDANLYTT